MAKREAVLKFRFDAQGGLVGIDRVDDKLKGVGRTADTVSNRTTRLGQTFRTALGVAAAGAVLGLTAALGRLVRNGIQLVEKAYRARGIQEIAEGRLERALQNLGGGAEEATPKLIEQAAALQKLTNFGDEQIITSGAILASFRETAGPEGIGLLLPRVLDLAAGSSKATGETMDLNTAALVLGRSLTQGAGALSRYGISMTEAQKAAFSTATGLERVSILAQIVDDNFGGMAETVVDPVKQLQNAAGDLIEVVGEGLRPELKALAEDLTEYAQSADAEELARQIGETLGGAIRDVFEFVMENKDAFLSFLRSTGELMDSIGEASDKFSRAIGADPGNSFFGIPLPTLQGTIDEIETLNRGLVVLLGLSNQAAGIAPVPAHARGGGFGIAPIPSHSPAGSRPTGAGLSSAGGAAGPGPAPPNPGVSPFTGTPIEDMLGDPVLMQNQLSAALSLTEQEDVILGTLRKLGDGALEMADAWERSADMVREAEEQKREALEATLQSMLASVDTNIRSTQDIVNATVAGVRQIIQAKLAEAIARSLAAAGPAAIFAAPFISAGLNAVFNNLLPSGLGGGVSVSAGSGGSGYYGAAGSVRLTDRPMSVQMRERPSSRADEDALIAEVRAVGNAIVGKEWTIEGSKLRTVSNRSTRIQQLAGNVRRT